MVEGDPSEVRKGKKVSEDSIDTVSLRLTHQRHVVNSVSGTTYRIRVKRGGDRQEAWIRASIGGEGLAMHAMAPRRRKRVVDSIATGPESQLGRMDGGSLMVRVA